MLNDQLCHHLSSLVLPEYGRMAAWVPRSLLLFCRVRAVNSDDLGKINKHWHVQRANATCTWLKHRLVGGIIGTAIMGVMGLAWLHL